MAQAQFTSTDNDVMKREFVAFGHDVFMLVQLVLVHFALRKIRKPRSNIVLLIQLC